MILFRDGRVQSPDGPARQIPTKKPVWTSALFITKDGCPRWRHYDIVKRGWRWGEEAPYVYSETGAIGIVTDHWIRIEVAIALAWLKRAKGGPMRVRVDGPPHLDNVEWEEGEGEEGGGEIAGERWRRLRYKCGAVPVEGYYISTDGRLKNERGEVTAGFYFNQTRNAQTSAGIVDLYAAAGLKQKSVQLRPAIYQATQCLLSGHGPADLADAEGIQLDTAWSYINTAAMTIRPTAKLAEMHCRGK